MSPLPGTAYAARATFTPSMPCLTSLYSKDLKRRKNSCVCVCVCVCVCKADCARRQNQQFSGRTWPSLGSASCQHGTRTSYTWDHHHLFNRSTHSCCSL
eukprot:937512-Amphidinium_carterae.1